MKSKSISQVYRLTNQSGTPIKETHIKVTVSHEDGGYWLRVAAVRDEGGYFSETFSLFGVSKQDKSKIVDGRFSAKKLQALADEHLDLRHSRTRFTLEHALWNTAKVYPSQISITEFVTGEISEVNLHPLSQAVYLGDDWVEVDAEQPERKRQSLTPFYYNLEELYKLLGCTAIEVVPAPGGNILIIDEEGKLAGRPKNVEATALAEGFIRQGDYIAGPAILCPSSYLQ